MKIMKSTNIELSMLQQVEDYIKIHNISFAEFIRRTIASYLATNQNVSEVSINGSEHDNSVDMEGHVSTPEPEEQPPEIKPETNKDTNNDFNWDGVNID